MATQAGIELLSQTVQGWEYASVELFAKEQAKNILQQKIAYYQSRIDFFEQKYALKFTKFCEKFSSIKNHSITEKEDDSMVWETSLDVIESYKKDLVALSRIS
jgi:hypothetical protein